MRVITATSLLSLLLAGGCPQPQSNTQGPVTANIACSATQGPAPLTVSFSAAESTSTNEGPLTYSWDFGDGSDSDEVIETHLFNNPGRYTVRLLVADQTGAQGIASVVIRAEGTSAVAVIAANRTSGRAPLIVQFDGTVSQVPDDTILDYYWDFGDGATSRDAQPFHVFQSDGQYTVTLRIVTAGGLEATTNTTITVGQRNGSLQFDGNSFATLPLGTDDEQTLSSCTFEAWIKANSEGGILATLGSGALTIEVIPASNTLRARINGVSAEATVTSLTATWRHVAVVYATSGGIPNDGDGGGGDGGTDGNGQPAGVCTLYLDGVPLTNANATGGLTTGPITLGVGMRGKIADVRFWAAARNAMEIAGAKDRRLSGTEPNLLGYWPLDEATGQSLRNAAGGPSGTLGTSEQVESADPAWSMEGPPL